MLGVLSGHSTLSRALPLLAFLLGFAANAHAANDGTTCLQGKNLDDARLEACARYIKSGKARGVNLALAYNARSVVFGLRGELDSALEEVDEAIRLGQGVVRSRDLAQLILNRGSVYWKKGDYDRALTEFDEAVRLNPKHAETYYWRGLAYVSKQDYDRAIAEYTTAIKRDPKDAEFHLRRCEAYSAKRDFDRALADCNEGLRRSPEKFPWGYTWRGVVYQGMGELDKARADYEHALSIDPTLAANASALLSALSQSSPAQAQTGGGAVPTTPPAESPPAPPAMPAAPTATPPEATPPSTNVAGTGGSDAPAAPSQGGVREVLEKFGMLGTWSVDCGKGTSPGDTYSIYRALDELRVQRDIVVGKELRPGTVEAAVEAGPNELVVTWVWEPREVVRLRMDGNRWRQMDGTVNGKKYLAEGVYTADLRSTRTELRLGQPMPSAYARGWPKRAGQCTGRYGKIRCSGHLVGRLQQTGVSKQFLCRLPGARRKARSIRPHGRSKGPGFGACR